MTAGTPALWSGVGAAGLVLLLVAWLGHEHIGWAARWDDAALEWGARQPPAVDAAALLLQTLGRGVAVLFAALVLGVLLVQRRRVWEGVALAAIVGAAVMTVALLKQLFGRVRPEAAWSYTSEYGFPSGHATLGAVVACFAVWFGLPLVRRRGARVALLASAVLWALAMAASRVALTVHYLTDVIGGLGLGLALSGFGFVAADELRRRWDVSPRAGHRARQNG